MATAPSPVSFEEYLHTSYSPDCEYIDGLILERNVGQGKHSFTHGRILRRLADLLEAKGLIVLPEQRTRVSPGRVRVPDVSVVANLEEITSDPPLLCVEVLSPDDRWSRVNASLSDYQSMAVPCVWVVDPYRRAAWIFDQEEPPVQIASDGFLRPNPWASKYSLARCSLPPNPENPTETSRPRASPT